MARYTKIYAVILCCVVVETGQSSTVEVTHSDRVSSIEARPQMQAHIEQTLEAYRTMKDGHKDIERGFNELTMLRKLAAGDQVEMVRQLAFAASQLENPEEVLVLLLLIDRLEIRDSALVSALAPYLYASDKEVGELSRDCFRQVEKGSWKPNNPLEPLNYRTYQDYIASLVGHNQSVPDSFVKWIYERHPGHAMLTFLYACDFPQAQRQDILWSGHIVDEALWLKANRFDDKFQKKIAEALSELHKLTSNKAWWVRLYVAQIMQQHLEFRQLELVQKLRDDKDPLVRQTIEMIESKPAANDQATPQPTE